MAIDKVRDYMKEYNKDQEIIEFSESSATVELAAHAVGCEPAKIAKTMSFYGKEEGSCILVVTAGDRRIDNSKFKHTFGMKAKMPKGEDVEALTGHAIGGVCPFAVADPTVKTYTDISLRRFDSVYPACGSSNSAIRLNCDELFEIADSQGWVDVCKGWEEFGED